VFGNAVALRQINTTGNLRMAAMCELPVGQISLTVIASEAKQSSD